MKKSTDLFKATKIFFTKKNSSKIYNLLDIVGLAL